MTTQGDIERAQMAARIIDNPIFDEAFAIVREGYVQGMMAAKTDDDRTRQAFTMALRSLETVKTHLKTVLKRGEIAAREVQAVKFEDPSVFKRTARGFF